MSPTNLGLVVLAAAIFVSATACAKFHVQDPAWWRLLGALALYTVGNLLLIRVLREAGLGLVISVSTVMQLIVVNLMAVLIFRERLTAPQSVGVALGVVAVVLMMLPPKTSGQ